MNVFIPLLSMLKGAAIAKKKMMKKFGWYKHSEDGGGTSRRLLAAVTSIPAGFVSRRRHSPPLCRVRLGR